MQSARDKSLPASYEQIVAATRQAGFTMSSDVPTGSLLKALAASKPDGQLLELGTGTGLSTAWLLAGMSAGARLTSVDNDASVLAIARCYLGQDKRLRLVHQDGGTWLSDNTGATFDFIFADTWHGKYLMLEEALTLLKPGGLYVIDDMLPQDNWPEGHAQKAIKVTETLEDRPDLATTQLHWASGIIICTKLLIKSEDL